MSRIVFTRQLRQTVTTPGIRERFHLRPKALFLVSFAFVLCASVMSSSSDLSQKIFPSAQAYVYQPTPGVLSSNFPSKSSVITPWYSSITSVSNDTPLLTPLPNSSSHTSSSVSSPLLSSDITSDPSLKPMINTPATTATSGQVKAPSFELIPKKSSSTQTLDRSAQRLADYISNTYRIAKEASQMIVMEAFSASAQYNVDPLLVLAIISIESRFNPLAASQVGALGLTQTMPKAHPEKVALIQKQNGHILNISDNINLGTKIISEYLHLNHENTVLALQQYNGSLKDQSRSYSNMILHQRDKLLKAYHS